MILKYYNPEHYIRIETDASRYTISGVLSQMTSDQISSNHVTHKNLDSNFSKPEIGQWHLIAFFSQKMIPTETRYKTYDQELLSIVKTFKTWRHYLKDYRYEVFVLTDNNNLQ